MINTPDLLTLPLDILFEIFKYFKYGDRLSASKVCRRLHSITKDKRLSIFNNNYKVNDSGIMKPIQVINSSDGRYIATENIIDSFIVTHFDTQTGITVEVRLHSRVRTMAFADNNDLFIISSSNLLDIIDTNGRRKHTVTFMDRYMRPDFLKALPNGDVIIASQVGTFQYYTNTNILFKINNRGELIKQTLVASSLSTAFPVRYAASTDGIVAIAPQNRKLLKWDNQLNLQQEINIGHINPPLRTNPLSIHKNSLFLNRDTHFEVWDLLTFQLRKRIDIPELVNSQITHFHFSHDKQHLLTITREKDDRYIIFEAYRNFLDGDVISIWSTQTGLLINKFKITDLPAKIVTATFFTENTIMAHLAPDVTYRIPGDNLDKAQEAQNGLRFMRFNHR